MRDEYDFTNGKRGPVIPPPKGKTRITIFIDTGVLNEFRKRAEKAGTGYQTMMNEALKNYLAEADQPVTEKVLRNVLREEVAAYLAAPSEPVARRAPDASSARGAPPGRRKPKPPPADGS